VAALLDHIRFAFQPLINLRTGGVVAVEALARPAGRSVDDLLRKAASQGRLVELDLRLASFAIAAANQHDALVPLHVNVMTDTITHDCARLEVLRDKLREAGRREHEVTVEIGPGFGDLEPRRLLTGIDYLRACGFRIALDHLGAGNVPLSLVADAYPHIVKLTPSVVRGLTGRPGRLAMLESVHHLCESTESALLVDGVDTEQQLSLLRRHGIRLVQGDLLAPPSSKPATTIRVPGASAVVSSTGDWPIDRTMAGPRVTEFLSPATMLPAEVTADEVRQVLADDPEIGGVVLVDEDDRPQHTIERNRFLLAVTGPYGYALHANKPASRLGDTPRLVTTSTTAAEALELITQSAQYRMHDDAIVVDGAGRCLGAVQAGHLIRGIAALKVEEAAALNPLTRMTGSDSIARDVARRIDDGEAFAVSWLDIDRFKVVNDTAGFSAGDNLIRGIGHCLTDAAATLGSVHVGHLGGDDFLVVAGLGDLVPLSEMLLDPAREAGGVPVTLSLATLVCTPGSVADYDEASHRLAPLKQFAKSLNGSSWVVSRPDSDHVEVRRGHESAADAASTEDYEVRRTESAEPDHAFQTALTLRHGELTVNPHPPDRKQTETTVLRDVS
jgi:EAL domain-containing protein (putative c-di-GMP-specific phosphodiesterase class I)/GGDEF domain-containing protein